MENDDGFWFKQKLCQWIYERNSSSGTVLPTLDTNIRPNSSHFCPLTKVVLCSSFTRKNWNTIGLKCRDTFQKSIGLQFLHKTLILSEFATSLKKFAKNRAFWNATIRKNCISMSWSMTREAWNSVGRIRKSSVCERIPISLLTFRVIECGTNSATPIYLIPVHVCRKIDPFPFDYLQLPFCKQLQAITDKCFWHVLSF